MQNPNQQSAATLNQIDNKKPNIPKSNPKLSGNINGSFNGGIHHIMDYKICMAGEKHKTMRLRAQFQMLTPITPSFQKLRGRIETHYVPFQRIWEDAEKFTAQNGGNTTEKVIEMPNTKGKTLPTIQLGINPNTNLPILTGIQNTMAWRDSYISSFYPRQGSFFQFSADYSGAYANSLAMPPANILPLRAVRAIKNDMWRNKEYDPIEREYKTTEVSSQEWASYLATDVANLEQCMCRARKNNSYYMNYRTELQGEDTPLPQMVNEGATLLDWMSWEHKADLVRQETMDSQLNTWDVIARIRGSKKLTEGKVQLIGFRDFEINYSAITQNTYNNNQEIAEEFRVMGKQGAYSYTYLDMPIYGGFETVEEGIIIISIHVYADTIFETGWERTLLNIRKEDQYRPELKDLKEDVIYKIESGTEYLRDIPGTDIVDFKEIYGFKRKFSEYFKLPNVCHGDMCTNGYYRYGEYGGDIATENIQISNGTYQFSMPSIERYPDKINEDMFYLDIWKDYTDILINKNLAIPDAFVSTEDDYKFIGINGQNQIFYGGELELDCELPIDKDIIDDFTEYGEH